MSHGSIPFPALVGLDQAQHALMLLAVDPLLGGVVLGAGAGTGKSSLMRGFAVLVAGLPHCAHLVEVPLGVTEDRLLGGLDLEATLATGIRHYRAGLLARADGGLLYVDNINLLDDSSLNHLLATLDTGIVRVEREGLSQRSPARLVLLATYDPAEGTPRRHLLDRVGIIVAPLTRTPARTRAETVRRNQQPDYAAWHEESIALRMLIEQARTLLPAVQISDLHLHQLAEAALAFGIEGQRADLFACRVALAAAALEGRDLVEQDDLELAVRLVLLPRATRLPLAADAEPDSPPAEPPPPPPPTEQDHDESESGEQQPKPDPKALTLEDLVLAAMETEITPDVLATPFSIRRTGRSGSRGSTLGKRGRHIRSVPGQPSRGRLDVIATLRAAAPWQSARQAEHAPPNGALGRRVQLRRDDLHIKQFRSKAGTLFCFIVDASGSMALHRMRQAKGAVNALLQQAYVHRDQVALIAFRGEQAEVLLPPSQSVELAKRALDVLPTGGGTPLASALLAAWQIAQQARSRGIQQTSLVLITDGRPNMPLQPQPDQSRDERLAHAREEVQRLAGRLRNEGLTAVVIDTQRNFLSRGEARQLAEWLGGRYVYLPQGNSREIVREVLAEERS